MKELLRTYGRLLRYASPYKTRLVIGIVSGFLSGGSLFGILQLLPNVVQAFEDPDRRQQLGWVGRLMERTGLDKLGPQGEALTWQFLLVSIVAIIAFFFFKTLCNYLNKYCMQWVGSRVILDLRNDLFSSLQEQSLIFYGKMDVGNLIARCVNDTSAVERSVASNIADLTRAPAELVALAAAVVYSSIKFDMVALPIAIFVVMPLCVLPIVLLGRRIKHFSRRSMERISDLVGRMHENFTGIRVVKAFHMESSEEKRFRSINEGYFTQVIRALRAELLMTPLMEFVTVLLLCILLVYCFINNIRLSEIVPLAGAAILAYDPIKRLAKLNAQLQRSMASAERIFELLDANTALPRPAQPKRLASFEQKVVFEHVSFRYDRKAHDVIDDVSLEIPSGRVVAVVGESGSGKTTMANLLARFYDVTSGAVTIDGIDVRELDMEDLRRLICVVTQETILFNDTIANNIAYGSAGASQAEIEAAARKANAHDFIVQDVHGYDRIVGEKGFVLSGGQRQRIAIARAILRNPQILILDEATSALDTATEQLIQEALDTLMKDRTTFAIAHRLSTIRHAYMIFVMDNGRIVEQGSHEELIQRNGRYRELYEMNKL